MFVRFTGSEEFTIPAPQNTKRRKESGKTFLVIREVGSEMRNIFDMDDELMYVNRYRGPDGKTRIEFRNLSLPPMSFKPNRVTEIADEEIAELFIACRFFNAADAPDDEADGKPKKRGRPKANPEGDDFTP